MRFELAFYALQPDIQVIAPWRIPEFYETFKGRNNLVDYAAKKGIPVTSTKSKPWSMDENLAQCSYEAGILEDPDTTPPADMWKLTADPILSAPNEPEDVTVEFAKGLPVKITSTSEKTATDPTAIFLTANTLARKHGVGRIDIVENRFIGLKSRGCARSHHPAQRAHRPRRLNPRPRSPCSPRPIRHRQLLQNPVQWPLF